MLRQSKLANRIKKLTAWSLVFAGILASQARAGIMLDGVPESQYLAFANQAQFAGAGFLFSEVVNQQTQQVTTVSNGSGTLIAPNWVLTAGHVGVVNPEFFQPGGTGPKYAVAQVITHPQFLANGSNINYGFDISLLRLSTATNLPYAEIYRGSNENNLGAAITGFGISGYGSTGGVPGIPQANRAGTNEVDLFIDFPNGTNGEVGAQNSSFLTDFDAPSGFGTPGQYNTLGPFGSSATASPLEYQLANQDSGGGLYVRDENGRWFVAGINSGILSQQELFTAFNIGGIGNASAYGYGSASLFTRVTSFQTFIDVNALSVPEPGSLALLSVIATGCVFSRRKKE